MLLAMSQHWLVLTVSNVCFRNKNCFMVWVWFGVNLESGRCSCQGESWQWYEHKDVRVCVCVCLPDGSLWDSCSPFSTATASAVTSCTIRADTCSEQKCTKTSQIHFGSASTIHLCPKHKKKWWIYFYLYMIYQLCLKLGVRGCTCLLDYVYELDAKPLTA